MVLDLGDDGVGAFVGVFSNGVACVINDVGVVAVASDHGIFPCAAIEVIIATLAIECVGSRAAEDGVVGVVAGEGGC